MTRFAARSLRYRSTMDPRVTSDCARASAFSSCGSWPRCAVESAPFARLRASSALKRRDSPERHAPLPRPDAILDDLRSLATISHPQPESGQGSVKGDPVLHASGKRQRFDIRLEASALPLGSTWEASFVIASNCFFKHSGVTCGSPTPNIWHAARSFWRSSR